jgi:hypothetical protein
LCEVGFHRPQPYLPCILDTPTSTHLR